MVNNNLIYFFLNEKNELESSKKLFIVALLTVWKMT